MTNSTDATTESKMMADFLHESKMMELTLPLTCRWGAESEVGQTAGRQTSWATRRRSVAVGISELAVVEWTSKDVSMRRIEQYGGAVACQNEQAKHRAPFCRLGSTTNHFLDTIINYKFHPQSNRQFLRTQATKHAPNLNASARHDFLT